MDQLVWLRVAAVLTMWPAAGGVEMDTSRRKPSPGTALTAAVVVGMPLTVAWFINCALRRARAAE